MSAHPDRSISLEGAFNFRDLGGYRAADGRSIRWRTLFRADGLHRLSGPDLQTLSELGLRTVIDLRTARELGERGRIEWPTAELAYHHLPLFEELPSEDSLEAWREREHMAREYLRFVTEGAATMTAALSLLADDTSLPAVFHCAAGKDRTGIVAAVTLGLLGVADDDIAEDYALSRPGMARMLEHLRSTSPERADELDRRAGVMLGTPPEVMHRFLALFRERFGSFDDYAAGLGLPGVGASLRDALLADPALSVRAS